jgi:NAD(P)-dependent dehydrogenase (short-subunit alcohol dehydrogenase family)|tara:strand:- start:1436 stop:2011 length:576 start_codon:yes stop_codon:yes gene_type:complete
MKIGITGSSGLAKTLAGVLRIDAGHDVKDFRIEDITSNDVRFWGFEKLDVIVNFAHDDFEQTRILEIAHRAWKDDKSKYIINISSRASQSNISKGYLYASAKASLNHLTSNLTYNSDKLYRICTINLGLLNSGDLPSLTHKEVAEVIKYLVALPEHLEIPEITIQHSANYQEVQHDKQLLKEIAAMSDKLI